MISEKENKRLSKWLSYLLRHHPEECDIQLDKNGWTGVQELVTKISRKEPLFTTEVLQYIVDTNSKKRFAFNSDHSMIRASQGHSVEIDPGYEAVKPPVILFHGTAEKNLPLIFKEGLKKMSRNHVHLSTGRETALAVGSRYGKPVVLEITAGDMYKDGFLFFLSENGVWLTGQVPPAYILQR